jgi:branched-chain amino acid transport system substrate-binding protein
MTKTLMSTLITVVLIMSFILSLEVGPVGAVEPVKIGAVLCITGWAGMLGTPEKEAIQMAAENLNRKGGLWGRPVEIYFEDDQSNPANSAVATTKLIRDKNVCAVIGSSITNMCMPMIPIVERHEVPNVSLGAGHEITDPVKKWVFRIPITDFRLSPFMLQFVVKELGAKRIALLYSTDASGKMGAKGVEENIGKYDAKIVITEQFDTKDTSMIPQLSKIKASGVDAIILYTSGTPAAVIAKNYKQLGMEIPVVGSHGIPTSTFTELAPPYIYNGRWILFATKGNVGDKFPIDDPYRKNIYDPFMKQLKEKYGQHVKFNGFYGNGYDGITLVIEALKAAGTDNRAAIRDAMEKVRFKGLNGEYLLFSPTSHDGQTAETAEAAMILKGGEWWPYKK